jgi:hypothetical protein
MPRPSKREIARGLLARHGRLYSEEVGANVAKGTPASLFQWLVASILLSARISHRIAIKAARALKRQGWTTAEKLAASTWAERATTLNRAGYARYDERTSAMLGATTDRLLVRYGGDLRKLRDAAGRDPARERALLKEFKGLGDVGVDIFFREVQAAWDELRPFADRRAFSGARRLDLGSDAKALARLVDEPDFPRLVAALVRLDFAKDEDDVLEAARGRS